MLPTPIYPNEAIGYKIDIFSISLDLWHFCWVGWTSNMLNVHTLLLPIGNHHKDIETMLCKFLNNHHYFCIYQFTTFALHSKYNQWLLLFIVSVHRLMSNEPMFGHVLLSQVQFQIEWNLQNKIENIEYTHKTERKTTVHCPWNSIDRITN